MNKNINIKKFKGFQNNGFYNIPIIIEIFSNFFGILKTYSDFNSNLDPIFIELHIKEISREDTNYSFWRNKLEYYTLSDARFYIIKEIDFINKNNDFEKILNQYFDYFGFYEVIYSEQKGILFGYYNYKDTTLLLTQTNKNYSDSFSFN